MVVARTGGCGGSQRLKCSRNVVNVSIYRFGKESFSPKNIPVAVAGICWCSGKGQRPESSRERENCECVCVFVLVLNEKIGIKGAIINFFTKRQNSEVAQEMWVRVAQKVHIASYTMKVHGGSMYRDTCHYIILSAQVLRATLSSWGIWRKQKKVGHLG